jgi:hypothetical protein
MALGTVDNYNQMLDVLMSDVNRNWDDATAGSNMFVLATSAYTPVATHTTGADLGANVITSGDGAPINVPSPAVNQLVAATWLTSGNADFGSTVTITAKWLICVQPVTAGTYASTAKLLWYVDLNVGSGLSLSSTASEYRILVPTNGWLDIT